MVKKRYFGPDLVRALACVFVLGVHFYLNTGFYERPYQGTAMMLSVPVRMALMSCVPLFLMLSGYLCVQKRWRVSYYKGIIPILLSYVLCGVICEVFTYFDQGSPISFLSVARRMLNFTAVPYGWYVEMYIGLFLIIPLINAVWNKLGSGLKIAAMTALVFLCVISAMDRFAYQFLLDLYPIPYYLLGAWLREHPIKLKGRWLVLGWLAFSLAACPLQYHLFKDAAFSFSATNYYGSLFVFPAAFCLFAALVRCEGDKLPKAARFCVERLARLSFCIYMLSYIGDALIYPRLRAVLPDFEKLIFCFVPAVLANLVLSAVLAQIVNFVSDGLLKLVPAGKNKNDKEKINVSEG